MENSQNDQNYFVLFLPLLRFLVGGFNLSEKYAREIGVFPQIGMKQKNL